MTSSRSLPDGPSGVQGTLDDLGTPLADLAFVVVDLETTGGSPADAAITEIGAVKVRGGEVLGDFATLVDPGAPIPPFITALTGITQQMVYAAPRIEAVLPAFLEFARGCVLVAHNAPFDIGFLKAACAAHGHPWPAFPVVDTVDLARRVLSKDEVPNCKLETLARFFRTDVRPNHRALADARATVDVLHGLIERLGAFGATSFEELRGFAKAPTPEQRRKRHLADAVPSAPGVYLFEDARGEVLYVGKSGDLRTRVRSYFTGSETRRRVREMVGLAERVRPIVCATGLEAEVRELRLIAAHKPRYNRRSKFPERASWLRLTGGPFARVAVVNDCRAEGAHVGPFASRRRAEEARAALHEAVPLRQCTQRLTLRLIESGKAAACTLAELGRCGAPCLGRETPEEYAVHAETARAIMQDDVRPVVAAAQVRIERLAAELRYEEAAAQRDRLAAFVRAAARGQRLAALAALPELVAARPAFDGGWELIVVRYGRLAATGTMPPRTHPRPYLDALVATAETVSPGGPPADGIPPGAPGAGAGAEEMECVLRWLEGPGVRLAAVDGDWTCPAHGAGGLRQWLDNAYAPVEPEARRPARPLR
ncbi:DEDD exonuclease domain-containing protein [Actinomadura parmotrematis]|uniref:DEDD exonuclease domain-containing protein n=1 Tax=Actinomadura parmotrematis TaxID=2864039 RepID=A0ABS7FM61_9ACTN|nr:DEDD exonuclease domain-containing protein [Actinomadura parmotrematis]MBW8480849.1 DEDD exonuclease domain-containing protein [Actinomadura parmotrematis]